MGGYISEKFGIDESRISIERAHRLVGKAVPKPIIVKFPFFKEKDQVLRAYRQKQKEKRASVNDENETAGAQSDSVQYESVRVSEDFVERVTKDHTKLYPYLQDCLKAGKEAFLRYDQLVVGTPHIYDYDKQQHVAITK